jgi:hypothetical protein
MHRLHSISLVALVVFAAFDAHAITISVAKIDKGTVQVKGRKTAPLALISWEGQPVAQSTKTGGFRFATSVLPQDCVGDLSDGSSTIPVVIQGCGPQGPPGPASLCQPNPCVTPPPEETPTPGAVTVRFEFIASAGIQGFQIRANYPTAKGSFIGTGENVACFDNGSGGIFTKNDDDASGSLMLSVANTSNLSFPFNIECTFTVSGIAFSAGDIDLTVQEVTQNNAQGDTSALTVAISLP